MCWSIVFGVIMLWIVVCWVWPILWILAVVWWYLAGVHGASMKSMFWAAVSVCPCAAASMLMMIVLQFGLVLNWCLFFSVCFGFCPPMMVGASSSFASVCIMWRWWAAITIFWFWSFAFFVHSVAWGILFCATIFLSSVSCMSFSCVCVA